MKMPIPLPNATLRRRLLTFFGLALLFLFGLVTGSLLTVGVIHKHTHAVLQGDSAVFENIVLRRMTRKLDLRDDQKPEVLAIVREVYAGFQPIREQAHGETVRLIDDQLPRLRGILDESQSQKLDEWLQSARARHFVTPRPVP